MEALERPPAVAPLGSFTHFFNAEFRLCVFLCAGGAPGREASRGRQRQGPLVPALLRGGSRSQPDRRGLDRQQTWQAHFSRFQQSVFIKNEVVNRLACAARAHADKRAAAPIEGGAVSAAAARSCSQGRLGPPAAGHAASAGGVNSWLLTTSATQPGGKRRDFMARYDLGLVLHRRRPHLGWRRALVEGVQPDGRSSHRHRGPGAVHAMTAEAAGADHRECSNTVSRTAIKAGQGEPRYLSARALVVCDCGTQLRVQNRVIQRRWINETCCCRQWAWVQRHVFVVRIG